MDIILRTNIDKLGQIGQLKQVKDGFARNYLIPKGLAVEATDANIKALQEENRRQIKVQEKEKKKAEKLAEQLASHSYTVTKRAGEEDRLFGAVTSQDIAESIKNEGIEINRKAIQLDEPIKKLGVYQIQVKIHSAITANIKVWVVKE